MRTPKLRTIAGIDEIGLHTDFVAMLGDASHQHRPDFQTFPNLPRIFLASLETKHRAARHDLEVGQLR